jgi:hypothetical protein
MVSDPAPSAAEFLADRYKLEGGTAVGAGERPGHLRHARHALNRLDPPVTGSPLNTAFPTGFPTGLVLGTLEHIQAAGALDVFVVLIAIVSGSWCGSIHRRRIMMLVSRRPCSWSAGIGVFVILAGGDVLVFEECVNRDVRRAA